MLTRFGPNRGWEGMRGNRGSARFECKKCDRCHTKQYGCTLGDCYCHTHAKEPLSYEPNPETQKDGRPAE